MRYFNNYVKKALLLGSMTFSLSGCMATSSPSPESSSPLKQTQFMMGTTITISLFDHQNEETLTKAFERISTLENELSINKENTLLDEVNDASGSQSIAVNKDMFDVIKHGLYYSELTDGSFDITVGPLVSLWRIGFPEARVPSTSEIKAALPLINYKNVTLDETQHTVYLTQPGMQIDLGGIAKGYAADEVVQVLKDNGVAHAIVDLGGNVYTLGSKVDGSPWKVGVQDPFNPRGAIIGYIPLTNKSAVTSGIYERFLEADGKKYHHILDPETGYPFSNEIVGVTIISETSMDGDALSTSVFSKGIEDGLAFVNALEGIDAIFISKDHKVYVTDGIKDQFVLDNPEFSLAN
ncbi:MAG: FAD:protein FMN transferase [Cellulosilyticaceae bacterium]